MICKNTQFHLNEIQYQNIIDSSLDGIIIFNNKSRVLRINPAAMTLFGYPEKELIGHNINLLKFSDCSEENCAITDEFPGANLSLLINKTCEVACRHKNGHEILLRLNLVLVESNEHESLFCSIFQDITANKRIEQAIRMHNDNLETQVQARTQQLRKARDQAQQANRAKNNFLANMSHELRTPLHGILSFSNMGIRRVDNMTTEKISNYFEFISNSGDRLLHLINGLLDLSRLDSNAIDLDIKAIDFNKLVQNCVNEQESARLAKGLTIDINNKIENDLIFCDKYRISQVISNLLSNAIKFSFPDQKIEILIDSGSLKNTSDAIRFIIKNKGQTIPKNEHESIFERFEQSSLDATATCGVGLGLAISREITNLHCGRLFSHPKQEDGACFELLLPKSLLADIANESH